MNTIEATEEYLLSLFTNKKRWSEESKQWFFTKLDLVMIKRDNNLSQEQKKQIEPLSDLFLTKINSK